MQVECQSQLVQFTKEKYVVVVECSQLLALMTWSSTVDLGVGAAAAKSEPQNVRAEM